MYAASLRRFRHDRLISDNLVLLYALIISLALLGYVVSLMAGALQSQPEPELLAPFRWLRADRMA